MFSKYFSNAQNISTFGVVSFLLFFSLFILVLIWLFTTKKSYFNKMKNLPFEEDDLSKINNENKL